MRQAFNSPKYEADGSSKPQVFDGDFCGHLLAALKEMGLEVAVVPQADIPCPAQLYHAGLCDRGRH